MSRVAIAPAGDQDTLEVDLWGTVFHRVPVTRSRQRALADLERQVRDIKEDEAGADDVAVALMGNMLDQILKPVEGDGSASSLIVEKWEQDELTFGRLSAFIEEVAEQSADPT